MEKRGVIGSSQGSPGASAAGRGRDGVFPEAAVGLAAGGHLGLGPLAPELSECFCHFSPLSWGWGRGAGLLPSL